MTAISSPAKDIFESKESGSTQTAGSADSIENLLGVVKASKVLSALYDQANQVQITAINRPLKVKFGPPDMESDAIYYSEKGKILLSKDRPFNERVSMLVFEMLNALSRNEFLKIQNAMYQGQITSPEIYAYSVELLEYQNLQKYWQIRTFCAKQEGWVFPEFYKEYDNFDAYLKDQIAGGHTEIYIQRFKEVQEKFKAAAILTALKSS
jgi:hypothetical protein